MYQLLTPVDDKVIAVHIEGKPSGRVYDDLETRINATLAKHGTVRLLAHLENFEGWYSLADAWRDLRLDLRHYNHIEKIAIVGENRWHEWATRLTRPFTRATVRYFPQYDLEAAWEWVHADEPPPRKKPSAFKLPDYFIPQGNLCSWR